MIRELNPDTFIDCWKEFVKNNKDVLLKNYDSPDWTKLVIGADKSTVNEGSPFGDHFLNHFGNDYQYRKEDGTVDLSIYKKEFVKDIYKISKKSHHEKINLDNCPVNYDILIEHENDPSKCYEEMYKLTYYRANLKVLVTYLWDTSTREDNWYEKHERMTDNFETIINQTNMKSPENVDTKYISIVAQRLGEKLIWSYMVFYVSSSLKQIHGEAIRSAYEAQIIA